MYQGCPTALQRLQTLDVNGNVRQFGHWGLSYRKVVTLQFKVLSGTAKIMQQIYWSLLGGVLLGVAAGIVLVANGRVAGVSGMVSCTLRPRAMDSSWRIVYLLGLIAGGGAQFVVCEGPEPKIPTWRAGRVCPRSSAS